MDGLLVELRAVQAALQVLLVGAARIDELLDSIIGELLLEAGQ